VPRCALVCSVPVRAEAAYFSMVVLAANVTGVERCTYYRARSYSTALVLTTQKYCIFSILLTPYIQ